jgi:cytochrome c5
VLSRRALATTLIAVAAAWFGSPANAQNDAETGMDHCARYAAGESSEAIVRGCYIWFQWAAGGEQLWRELARRNIVDIFAIKASGRYDRQALWRQFGVINDPNCTPRTAPDAQGLMFDDCSDDVPRDGGKPRFPGQPTGVVGLRKFPNPKFDPAAWNPARYFAGNTRMEPPYLVGMTCAVCHATFNPVNPPKDPANPKAENIAGTLGNIYLREGNIFTESFKPDDFLWHYGRSQPAGTSDTSRVASDGLYNPNSITGIFMLADRLTRPEKQADGSTKNVHLILKDGSDSVGLAEAALRVYVNIGLCSDYWLSLQDPLYATRQQQPFKMAEAKRLSTEGKCLWNQTAALMDDVGAYLTAQRAPKLLDAPDGVRYVDASPQTQARGAQVFARTCAGCHSSKRPPNEASLSRGQVAAWFSEAVKKPDFLEHNYLADERRYPVTLIGTNLGRTLGTNPGRGHIWNDFSSETYKTLPPVGEVKLLDWSKPVLIGEGTLSFEVPGDGRGYYRTPTLAGVWSTAPLLHTNALGRHIADPSVGARMAAFEDAMHKLLWPETREGVVLRSSQPATLRLPIGCKGDTCAIDRSFPAGTPISLVMSVDPQANWFDRLREFWSLWLFSDAPGRVFRNPDLVLDRGHLFGATLSDADKQALIEFVKTF